MRSLRATERLSSTTLALNTLSTRLGCLDVFPWSILLSCWAAITPWFRSPWEGGELGMCSASNSSNRENDQYPSTQGHVVEIEPPRDFRRLQLLREWSHDEADEQQVFT